MQIAVEAVREAEQRRDEQARIVGKMTGSPGEIAHAKLALAEMNHTLAIARFYQCILAAVDD